MKSNRSKPLKFKMTRLLNNLCKIPTLIRKIVRWIANKDVKKLPKKDRRRNQVVLADLLFLEGSLLNQEKLVRRGQERHKGTQMMRITSQTSKWRTMLNGKANKSN